MQRRGKNQIPEYDAHAARAVAAGLRDGYDVAGVACSGFAHLAAANVTGGEKGGLL